MSVTFFNRTRTPKNASARFKANADADVDVDCCAAATADSDFDVDVNISLFCLWKFEICELSFSRLGRLGESEKAANEKATSPEERGRARYLNNVRGGVSVCGSGCGWLASHTCTHNSLLI